MSLLGVAQSALDPAGPQAATVKGLWWLFHTVMSVVYFIVIVFALLAIKRRKDGEDAAVPVAPHPATDRRMHVVVTSAVAVTILILFVFLISDFIVGRKLYALSSAENQLEIQVIGHQWWWEVQYQDSTPSHIVRTSNEIHIPVGTPIKFVLDSRDVIHSFWVPNLSGKKDLIPGHPSRLWMQADTPGTYDGQCAEFCGHQHAHMRLQVIAEDRTTFDTWLEKQRRTAPQPSTNSQLRGQEVFLNSTCVMCHTISGTGARGSVGPILSSIGARKMIAANTLPNTAENLFNWIRNPQAIKPGVIMPQNGMSDDDLHALVDYLESLK
jgi:cytochrome c oxidase subunit 2